MVTSKSEQEMVSEIRERMELHGIYVTELAKEVRRNRKTFYHWMNNMSEKHYRTLMQGIDRILERGESK